MNNTKDIFPAGLVELAEKNLRICFYPSSGFRLLWAVMDLDCDYFVFTDKRRKENRSKFIQDNFSRRQREIILINESPQHLVFRVGNKHAILFTEDNNDTLERFKQSGRRVHHFVGICDGCCEGGNHECIHERPFVSRLLQVVESSMSYTTDHSRPLETNFSRGPFWGKSIPTHPKFSAMVDWQNFPEPPPQTGARHDEHLQVKGSPVFTLKGVLVAPQWHRDQKLLRSDLTVISYIESTENQLQKFIPFRTLLGRGVIAEYLVKFNTQLKNHAGIS